MLFISIGIIAVQNVYLLLKFKMINAHYSNGENYCKFDDSAMYTGCTFRVSNYYIISN